MADHQLGAGKMTNFVGHVGIDTSKDDLVCTFLERHEEAFTWRQSYSNDASGFDAILKSTPLNVAFVIEPTGNYSLPFVRHATTAGRPVLLAPPLQAKLFL